MAFDSSQYRTLETESGLESQYQDTAGGGISSLLPAAASTVTLPEGWGVSSGLFDEPTEKINWFNQNQITPEQILALDPAADIDWMWNNGYLIGAPTPTVAPTVTPTDAAAPATPIAQTANPFKDYMYAGGADDALATQRGVQYAREQGWTPDQTVENWNQALGTTFTLDDYYRLTGLSPDEAAVASSTQPTFSNFGDAGSWDFGQGAVYDAQTNLIKAPGTVFQSGKDAIVSDELFWNPHSVTGADLQKRIQDTQAQGQRAGVVITPYAVFQGKATNEQLLDEIKNSGTDFVTIDPYYLGFGASSKELFDWAKSFIPQVNALGKEVKLVTQGFAPKGQEQQTLEHNQKMLALPGVSEFINFGLEDAKDLQGDPNWVSIGNDYTAAQPAAEPANNQTAGITSLQQSATSEPTVAPTANVTSAPFNPVGFDWSQGVQNIDGTIYQPQFESVQLGHGEEGGMHGQGALQSILRYKEGQTAPGQTYEFIDPATGQVTGTGKFKEQSRGFFGDLFNMTAQAAADLGPILQFTPLAPLVQAVNAVSAIDQGNVAQGIGALAGLGGYTDIANAAKLVSAVQNEDPLAALSAGMNLTGTTDIGGFTTKDLTAANAVVKGVQSGDYAQALSGVSQLTDNADLATASSALSFVKAAESGDPLKMLTAGQKLTGAIDDYNTRQTIATAYADPSRSQDTVLVGDIRGAGTQTQASADLGGVDLAEPTVTPSELAKIVSGNTAAVTSGTTPGSSVASGATVTTATSTPSNLPAFNNAAIRTLEQSRAAEIIAQMYPGQSLDWVNQEQLNAAAAHIRAGDEAGLISRLQSGAALGTGDVTYAGATDYQPPEGYRVAQPGEVGSEVGYTERGVPVQLVKQYGTTARKMTPAEKDAYDAALALEGAGINPETGQPYTIEDQEFSKNPIVQTVRGITSSLAGGVGEQAAQIGTVAGWLTGNKENALTRWGADTQQWADQITPESIKKGQDDITKRINDAQGLPAKAWAAVTGSAENPLALLHWIGKEGIQEVLPLGAAVTVGRGVSAATKLKFGEDLATKYGLGAAIGTDATLNAGESAAASYKQVYDTLRDKGVSENEAHAAAGYAAAGSGLVTLFTAAIGDAALVEQLMKGVRGATLKATLKEAPTEFAEGALQNVAEQNAVNVALGKGLIFDPNEALTSGVLEKLIGASTTGAISAGANVLTPGAVDTSALGSATQSAAAGSSPAPSANTIVATDPATGEVLTVDDLTGGTASTTANANTIVGTDESGNAVTLGDLGLGVDASTAPKGPTTPGASNVNTGSVLSVDPTNNTALVADQTGNAQIVDASAGTKVGDKINLGPSTLTSDTGPASSDALLTGDTSAFTGPNVGPQLPSTLTGDAGPATSDALPTGDVSAFTGPDVGPQQAGTVLAVDPSTNTALISDAKGNVSTVNTTSNVKVGDQVNLGASTLSSDTGPATSDALLTGDISAFTGPDVGPQQPSTPGASSTLGADTVLATDAAGNTLTGGDLGLGAEAEAKAKAEAEAKAKAEAEAKAAQAAADAKAAASVSADTNAATAAKTGSETTTDPKTNITTTTQTNVNTGVVTETNTNPNTGVTTTTETNPTTNTTTTTEINSNTNTTVTTTTNTNTGVTTQTTVNTNTNTKTEVTTDPSTQTTTTVVVDTNTDEVLDVRVDPNPDLPEQPVPPSADAVTAPPPPPPPPSPPPPSPPAVRPPLPKPPVVKPPSPAPAPAAQSPQMTPELAAFMQELMRTEEADLEAMTMVRKAEREEKRKGAREKLKSRKA